MIGASDRAAWPRTRSVLLGAALVAAAVVAGVWLAGPHDATIRAGAATLTIPHEWRTAHRGSTLVLAPRSGRVLVAFAPTDDRSLIPAPLRDWPARSAPPSDARLAGHRAWAYRAGHVELTVLPTERGVLGVACVAAPGCAGAVTSVSVGEAAIYAPAADLAFRLRLRPVLAALDSARVRTRAELARADGAATRTRLARRLAAEHRAAAATLRPLGGARLVSHLSQAADAYDELAGSRSAGQYAAARANVEAADKAMSQDLARLPPSRPGIAPAPAGRSRPAPAVLLIALALLVVVAAARAVRRPRTVVDADRSAEPAPRPVSGPDPAPPAPAFGSPGRWDASPGTSFSRLPGGADRDLRATRSELTHDRGRERVGDGATAVGGGEKGHGRVSG